MKKVMMIFGTRPEAIKMIPIIREIQEDKNLELKVCITGQHKDMLNQVLTSFNISVDYDLEIMREVQTLSYITTSIIQKLDEIIKQEQPDIILVHGDTTTAFSSALVAFYNQVKIGHVEAGLRTYDKYSPFPEEMNRVLISDLADIHFAPTENNKKALIAEGVDEEKIYVTGNTVIDTINLTINQDYKFENSYLNNIKFSQDKKYILLTAHRKENLGIPLENICKSINELTHQRKDIEIIFPVHYNPKVREIVFKHLKPNKQVHLLDPINAFDMHNLMNKCYLILTDSGGLQEEAPALGKPVLILRENTERPEVVECGAAKLVGTNEQIIIQETGKLLDDVELYKKMSQVANPYGDGHASERIVYAIKHYLTKSNSKKYIKTKSKFNSRSYL